MLKRWGIAIAVGVSGLLVIAGLAGASAQVQPGGPAEAPPAGNGFVDEIDNQYFPLDPGTVFQYQGSREGQTAVDSVSVTHRTKLIVGVRCVVVHDVLNLDGHPAERTNDYYAQDNRGNVWYFGEDSFDFENGKWVRSDGSWRAGVDGARQGIIMEAQPRVGDVYQQEFYAGHAEDMAKVLSTDARVTVPYGRFEHALKTKEWTPLEPGVVDNKYYAPGVGEVRSLAVRGGSEEMNLVSVTDD